MPIAVDPELERRLARLRQETQEKAAKAEESRRVGFKRWILLFMLFLAICAMQTFQMGEVRGKSMEPLLTEGDKLVILKPYRTFSSLKAGDIVVVRPSRGEYSGEEWVKRVVFVQNATGDAPFPETITNSQGTFPARTLFPRETAGFVKIPPKHIYILGDNLGNSTDSRDDEIGAISPNEIVGKVINIR